MIVENDMTTIASGEFLSIEVRGLISSLYINYAFRGSEPQSMLVRFQLYDQSSCSVRHLIP